MRLLLPVETPIQQLSDQRYSRVMEYPRSGVGRQVVAVIFTDGMLANVVVTSTALKVIYIFMSCSPGICGVIQYRYSGGSCKVVLVGCSDDKPVMVGIVLHVKTGALIAAQFPRKMHG